jgi:hypothetical protein
MPVSSVKRAPTREQLRKLLHALFHLLDDSETDAQTGAISIDAEISQRPLRELMEIADEIELTSHEDVDELVEWMLGAQVWTWPTFGQVKTWPDVKRLMTAGFDLVMEYGAQTTRAVYVLYRGQIKAPVNVLPQSAITAASRRGLLPPCVQQPNGTWRYSLASKTSGTKPRSRKGRKSNAARVQTV